LKGSNSDKWKEVMKDEMKALERNATGDLVELPSNIKTIGCKWVYKLKKGVDDKMERYKARLVAKGYSWKKGIDFHEIFSPIVKIVSIRIVLALVSLLDLELEQLDVKIAFFNMLEKLVPQGKQRSTCGRQCVYKGVEVSHLWA